jgi:hypothetical protein
MAADPTGLPVFTLSQEHTPARSVALITAEMPGAFPRAGGRALEVAMVAVDDIVNRMYPWVELFENSKNGEEYHAAEDFDFC